MLYHQTSVRFLPSILSKGLVPRKPDEWAALLEGIALKGKPVIWFTDYIHESGTYLHPSKCLIQVDSNLLDKTKLKKLNVQGWWIYEGEVPLNIIIIVDWHLYRKSKPKFQVVLNL